MAGGGGADEGSLPSWNIVVICTVGGVLFFDLICRQLDAAAKGKRHAIELLEGLYRELSVLGIVAFVLWSIQHSSYFKLESNDKHLFEAIHMTLFLAAVFHSAFVGMVALYSRQTMRRWDIFEDDEMRRYKDLKALHKRTARALGLRGSTLKRGVGPLKSAWLWIWHPSLSRRLWQLSEHVSYHALRSHFIKDNHLPKNFRFAQYLKKCEQDVVIEIACIKESVWVCFIVAVGFELYVKGLMGLAETNKDVNDLFLFAAVLVMAAALAVHFKLGKIYRDLLYSYTIKTDRREEVSQFLAQDSSNAQVRPSDMFWFGKPDLMLTTLQFLQFLLAVMVALLIWFGAGDSTGVVVVAEILLAIGAVGIYVIVLPKFIPAFTVVTHVGSMVNRQVLTEALDKQKRSFKRRALPPTLRQVTVVARVKASEGVKSNAMAGLRKAMSGHVFRELVQVFISIHFFLVAYNADLVDKGKGVGGAWVSEVILAVVGVLVEIATHIVVWGGKPWCSCNPFLASPERNAQMGGSATAAMIFPASSSRRILEGDQDGASPPPPPPRYYDDEPDIRCSFWACFGWRGGGKQDRGSCGGIPPEAAIGAWRTLDACLVVFVLAMSIATRFVSGDARKWVHALQGLVLLRLWPLYQCPLPSSTVARAYADGDPAGGGGAVNPASLGTISSRRRQEVMDETLTLLRGQVVAGESFLARTPTAQMLATGAAVEKNRDDHEVDIEGGQDIAIKKSASVNDGAIEEEKEGEFGRTKRQDSSGVPNLGVAVAFREACAAHPELVRTHGPFGGPILRAMLGLDPHKIALQDDTEEFDAAARAVALASSRPSGTDAWAANGSRHRRGFSASGERGMRNASSVLSVASGNVSPPRFSSTSSSSSDSSSEYEHRVDRQSSGTSAGRGRMSSLLNMSRAGRRHRQQQRRQEQQQQQMQMQMDFQEQPQSGDELGGSAPAQRPVSSPRLGGGEDNHNFVVPVRTWHPSGRGSGVVGYVEGQKRQQQQQLHGHSEGRVGQQDSEPGRGPIIGVFSSDTAADLGTTDATPTFAAAEIDARAGAGGGGGGGGGRGGIETSSWHHDRDARIGRRTLSQDGGAKDGVLHQAAASTNKLNSSRHHKKGRGRHKSRRRGSPSGGRGRAGTGEVMPAAVEDMERPVLPSFSGVGSVSGGSQHSRGRMASADDWAAPQYNGVPKKPASGGVHSHSDHPASRNGPFPLHGDSPARQGGGGRIQTQSLHSTRGVPPRWTPALGLGRLLAPRDDLAEGGNIVEAVPAPAVRVGVEVGSAQDRPAEGGGGGEGRGRGGATDGKAE